MSANSDRYDSIDAATESIRSLDAYLDPSELLVRTPSEQTVARWTETLTGFEAGVTISEVESEHLDQIQTLYDESRSALEEFASDHDLKQVSTSSPEEVLFMVCFRELQEEQSSRANLNPHKFDVLRGGRFDIALTDDQPTSNGSPADDNVALEELRRRAEEAGSEEVTVTQSTTSTEEYSRSEEVKRYVKARAAGQCEGCESDAPFKNKDNEWYLHAHHVKELSSGGPDTLESVIALCPNCHYQVHHGKDGEEYNEDLIEKLEEIEG
jgi:5-methylcytosine-specific restriction endonuclease McrA